MSDSTALGEASNLSGQLAPAHNATGTSARMYGLSEREHMATPKVQIVKVGDAAPDFALRALDGEEVKLSDYRGKRLVLFMWASW